MAVETVVLCAIAAIALGAALWRYRRTSALVRREEVMLRTAAAALTKTGEEFLPAVAHAIATSMGAELALIGELVGDGRVQTLAVAHGLEPGDNVTLSAADSPASTLIVDREFCCLDNVRDLFPKDPHLAAVRARGCTGIALLGSKHDTIGVILAATSRPISDPEHAKATLLMFAGRVAVEIEHARAERELRRSEEHLLQVQRVEAIGRLAGGVAHDFNNLLMIMIGYAEILRDRDGASTELTELLAAANRATTLTRQLLAFGRRQVLQTQRLDMNRVVGQVQTMLVPVIGSQVRVTTSLDPALPAVEADPGQMEQVLVNLALNARDAMPQGGTLLLETRVEQRDHAYFQMPAGTYVCLSVSDTGVGMPADVQAHIFEPFYTTKGNGGTGLGLSSVYGIIKQSGGFIWCESEPGRGTRFTIYFNPAKGETAPAAVDDPVVPVTTGSERVLVVDDEPGVRKLLARLLSARGYAVHEAQDGRDALAFLSTTEQTIDLVVTDIVMPGMNGIQLAEEIIKRWPQIKLLFVSGYSQTAARASTTTSKIPVLGKPFTPARIATAVREMLDRLPPTQNQPAG